MGGGSPRTGGAFASGAAKHAGGRRPAPGAPGVPAVPGGPGGPVPLPVEFCMWWHQSVMGPVLGDLLKEAKKLGEQRALTLSVPISFTISLSVTFSAFTAVVNVAFSDLSAASRSLSSCVRGAVFVRQVLDRLVQGIHLLWQLPVRIFPAIGPAHHPGWCWRRGQLQEFCSC